MGEATGLRFRERQPVGARIEIHLREARLDVLAHFDRALMEEGLAVIKEVDADEPRPRFVDDAAEYLEVEHAGLPCAGDAGLRRTARFGARDVAGGRALDI